MRRALGFALLAALLAGEALLPGRYLSRRDTFRMHLPLREFVAHEWSEGRFPTWNHLDGLGVSLPGTAIAAVTHPLQVLLLVLPPDVALKWQVLLCLALAGLGAALLAKRQGGPESSWWLAGLAYAGSGYLLSSTDNFTYLHGAALLPWALWAAERLAEAPSISRAAALGALLALGLHGGDVQGTMISTLLASTWTLGLARERRAAFLQLLAAGGFTVLLTAPLLPAIAATALESGRAAGLQTEEVLRWSLSPLRLLELPLGPLIPVELLDFHGPLLVRPLGGHTGALWVASEFIGIPVLILAALGWRGTEGTTARRYAALFVLGLLLSLGSAGGLYELLLKLVPGWSAFRYPEKLMPLAVLGLSLLAARGAAQVERRRLTGVLAILFAVALLPLAALFDARTASGLFQQLPGGAPLPEQLAEDIATGLRASATVALISCVALAWAWWRRPSALAWVAVGALALQSAFCARGLLETRPREDLALTPTLLPAVKEAGGARTRLAAWPDGYTYRGERFAATAAARRGDFEALAPEHNMRFGVGNLYAYLPGASGEIDRACSVRPQCTSLCARRLGAGLCIVSPELIPALEARGAQLLVRSEELDQPRLALLRDPSAREWASVPGIKPLEHSGQLRDALMQDTTAAFLVGAERDYPADPTAITKWERPRPDLAEVELTLTQENVLVFTENCARGWSARVDDTPSTPLRVDGGLCAVKVPAGTHHVTLRYQPPGWRFGWVLFGAGALCAAIILARSVRRWRAQMKELASTS